MQNVNTAFVAAALFWIGNMLRLVFLGMDSNNEKDYNLQQLEPLSIQQEWIFRITIKPYLLSSRVLNSLAWFVFCFPLFQLAYVLHTQKGSSSSSMWIHCGIVILALGGTCLEWIGMILYIGSTLACEYMVNEFNLTSWTEDGDDNLGWKSLEVAYFVIRGMKLWVDAFEWIVLYFIMGLVHEGVRRYRAIDPDQIAFEAPWNALGLIVGILALMDFVAEILKVTSDFELLSEVAYWYGTVNRLILMPAWLAGLGVRLPHALKCADRNRLSLVSNDTTLQASTIVSPLSTKENSKEISSMIGEVDPALLEISERLASDN